MPGNKDAESTLGQPVPFHERHVTNPSMHTPSLAMSGVQQSLRSPPMSVPSTSSPLLASKMTAVTVAVRLPSTATDSSVRRPSRNCKPPHHCCGLQCPLEDGLVKAANHHIIILGGRREGGAWRPAGKRRDPRKSARPRGKRRESEQSAMQLVSGGHDEILGEGRKGSTEGERSGSGKKSERAEIVVCTADVRFTRCRNR